MVGRSAALQALQRRQRITVAFCLALLGVSARFADAQASPPAGGFGQAPPAQSQCDANGPRLECGMSVILMLSFQCYLHTPLPLVGLFMVLHKAHDRKRSEVLPTRIAVLAAH